MRSRALRCGERPRVLTPTRARRLPFRGSHERERHDENEPEASPRQDALVGQPRTAAAHIGTRRVARTAAQRRSSRTRSRAAVSAPRMRTAIVSTYPPRACGIGTFAADLRGTLLAVPGIEGADLVAVVNEPSSPQRRFLLATIAQSVRGDYVRTARMLG